jgi:hypothetical protein
MEELVKIARNPTGIVNYYIEPEVPIRVEPFAPVVALVPAQDPITVVSNILSLLVTSDQHSTALDFPDTRSRRSSTGSKCKQNPARYYNKEN